MRKLHPVALLWLCWLASCTTPTSIGDTSRLVKLVEMKKGPCFGQCPVFDLTVYANGLMSYRGERYTNKMGLYHKRLAKQSLNELKEALRRANLWQYANVYRSDFPDLPAVTITYFEGDKSKTILGKENRPDAVIELENYLTQLADAPGWKLHQAPQYQLPSGAIPNQLSIELREETNPEAWVAKYARYEMKLLKRIWPSQTKIITSYNLKLIDPTQILDIVRQDAEVLSAAYNTR